MDDNKTKVTSSGKLVSDDSTREQEEKLREMKERAEKAEKAAKEKKAEKDKAKEKASSSSAGKTTAAAAVAAGAAALGGLAGKGKKKAKKKLITILVVIAIIAVVLLLFGGKLKDMLGISSLGSIIPGSLSAMEADEVMGYNVIDFQNAVLGDEVSKKELIVMEQPVEVESQVSQALANITLFQKTKIIHSFGTGVYTVDMSKITAEDIAVDTDACTVTITIPNTVLQYVNIDHDKTEFEDTQHAILAFGDLKMTLEQQELLEISITDAMREQLDTPELYTKANEYATNNVREIYQEAVSAVAEEFIVKVVVGSN